MSNYYRWDRSFKHNPQLVLVFRAAEHTLSIATYAIYRVVLSQLLAVQKEGMTGQGPETRSYAWSWERSDLNFRCGDAHM
jgi:hypothetical protein